MDPDYRDHELRLRVLEEWKGDMEHRKDLEDMALTAVRWVLSVGVGAAIIILAQRLVS